MNDTNSLAHTKWNCKYHIVFAPKYRRKCSSAKNAGRLGKYCGSYANGKR